MKYPSINDIKIIKRTGSWPTKSGGELTVLYGLPFEIVERFFNYDHMVSNVNEPDIRGMRSYRVSNIPKGAVGANEWHKVRNEIVSTTSGAVKWTCEDLMGGKKEFIIEDTCSIYTPHHIMHTYESLADGTTVTVTTNTLFFPDDTSSHDSYPRKDFELLKAQVEKNA